MRFFFLVKADGFSAYILFFFLKEKEAKRIKNPCRIYRLCQCKPKHEGARLSPLVILPRYARKIRRNREAWERFTSSL